MIGVRKVQNCIAQQNHQFLVLAVEGASQRLVSSLNNDAISDPLPKLSLGCPKLSPVTTDDQRGFALLLLFLVFYFFDCHIVSNTLVPLRGNSNRRRTRFDRNEATHSTPKGSLMCKAASGFQREQISVCSLPAFGG